ncbi:methylmalonyl-CoA epimerase [Ilumatobacter fluminis]|uniref:Methylmalonyl-CoA epimerase n=1 Tax=Ilumatobacter fluminis TaxID=467091 RepID=A0A4R7HXF7_9ACTN|nr:VOC family protein [Ilumatobacter fluminis]TDT14896.1 methylmalonyl-CoA epimerase [Ilumatobacter fluminis]
MSAGPPWGRLDHVALVVPDTDDALAIWRDLIGLPELFSEVVQNRTIRLTHLDLGATELQLVEPLVENHPLMTWIEQHGAGLHHLCFEVDDFDAVFDEGSMPLEPASQLPHEATLGRRAVFLDNGLTSAVIELISRR